MLHGLKTTCRGGGPALVGCRHPRAEESLAVLRLIRSNSLSLLSLATPPPPRFDTELDTAPQITVVWIRLQWE